MGIQRHQQRFGIIYYIDPEAFHEEEANCDSAA